MTAPRCAVLVLVALLAAACATSGAEDQTIEGPRLRVVTTVSPITDIVRQVAGEAVEVTGLIPEGTNSHTFEPPPSAARTLAEADLFIANGLFLEEPALELAEANLPDAAPLVTLADQVVSRDEWVFDSSFPEAGGRPNPHLWTDVTMAQAYARLAADALTEVDPEGATGYDERLASYLEELEALDAAVREASATVPAAQRKLVTYHDSFPYFSRTYGFEVVAAIQPSDFSEPSLTDVRAIIDQVRAAGVPAIFGSEVFPSDVLAQIAEETGATYVDDLRDDDLPGEPGEPGHSYVGMMARNVSIIVRALGGDPAALEPYTETS